MFKKVGHKPGGDQMVKTQILCDLIVFSLRIFYAIGIVSVGQPLLFTALAFIV